MSKSRRSDTARHKRASKQLKAQKTARNIEIDISRYCGQINRPDQIFEMYRQFDADYTAAKEFTPNLTKAEFRRNYSKINLDNLFRCLNLLNKKQNTSIECDKDDDDLNLVMKALSLADEHTSGGSKTRRSTQRNSSTGDKLTPKELEAAEALLAFYNFNSLPHDNARQIENLNTEIKEDTYDVLARGAKIFHNLNDCAQSYMSYVWTKTSGMLKNISNSDQITNVIEYTKENMYSVSMYIITVSFLGSTDLPRNIIKILYDILVNYNGLIFLKYIGGICATRHVARKLELYEKLMIGLRSLKQKINEMTDEKDIETVKKTLSYIKTLISYVKELNIFKSKTELESLDRKKELALLKDALASAKKEEQEIIELDNAKKSLIDAVDELNTNTENYMSTCENLHTVTETRKSLRKRTKSIPRPKSINGGKRHTRKNKK